MIVVPDASVILKWVLGSGERGDVGRALELQDTFIDGDVELRVPTLWQYEVGNVLGQKQPSLARELMKTLLEFELPEAHLTPTLCDGVLRHMREINGVTFYDSCYHVLAIQSMGVFLTADKEYVKRARRKGAICLLSEWKRLQ